MEKKSIGATPATLPISIENAILMASELSFLTRNKIWDCWSISRSGTFLMYFKHSLLTWALLQKLIYSACFLTTEDGIFIFNAYDSAANAAQRFDDGSDGKIFVDITIVDGVNARAFTASGVTTSGTSGYSATVVPRGKQTLREFSSSFDLPLPSLHLAAGLGMIASMGLIISMMRIFFCDVSMLLKDDVSYTISYTSKVLCIR